MQRALCRIGRIYAGGVNPSLIFVVFASEGSTKSTKRQTGIFRLEKVVVVEVFKSSSTSTDRD